MAGDKIKLLLLLLPVYVVYEVERVLNSMYSRGEHCWKSNVAFSAVYVSMSVSHLVLF